VKENVLRERKEHRIEELLFENETLKAENKAARERIAALRALQQIAQSLTSELNLEPLLKNILCSSIEVMDASAGSLLLIDPATDDLVFEVIEGGEGEALQGQRMAKDKGIAGWVVTNRRPLIVNDVDKYERHYKGIETATDFKTDSLICVPLLAKGKVIGALEVLNKQSGENFKDKDLDILTTFAAQSATAIENARLYRDLRAERDRIVALEEEVRKRLARDLHDGPAQLLSAIIMSVQFAQEILTRTPEKLDKLGEELRELEPLATKALHQLRTMLFDLRPVVLETQGLAPALKSYVKRLRLANDFAVNLEIKDFSERLEAKTEAAIFSIVQEAVGNARKYAHANHLELGIARRDGNLVVTVRDDGQGFDIDRVDRRYDQCGSLGLLNMRERAEMLNGEFSIESAVGQGTLVKLVIPLQANGGTGSGETEG
jgi:signal transduction histidine kinase